MATSTRSRYFRLLFAVALIFALMTPLTAAAQDSDPHFNVDPDTGAIWGHEWLAESTITITVDGSVAATAPTYDGGNFSTGIDPAAVGTGALVVVTDGTSTKDHTVTAVRISGVDQDAETITGVAEAGTVVNVEIYDATDGWREETADVSGDWTADFSTPGDEPGEEATFDLGPWWNGAVFQNDGDGDGTRVHWRIPNPALRADPVERAIFGDEWPPGNDVAVTLNGESLGSAPVGDDGYFWFHDLDLAEGDVITGTDGETLKDMVVEGLVYSVDPETDRVFGTGDAGENWLNWVHDPHAFRSEIADGAGEFTADFSVPGEDDEEQDLADIGPGSNGESDLCDAEADCTIWRWSIPNPIFRVDPQGGGIWGHEWYGIDDVTVNVAGTDVETVGVDGNGDWGTGVDPADLAAGIVVTVTGGDTTKVLELTELSVTLVDEAEDAVLGTAEANSEVFIEIHDVPEGIWRRVIADDPSGDWTADFTDPISDENGEGSQDFSPGVHGAAYQQDVDGDTTWIDWQVRFPRIGVEPRSESLWGHEWTPNSAVDITINGTFHSTLPTNEWGDFGDGWDPSGVAIENGVVVEVTDGDTTKTHTVTPLAITDIDIATDEMSGTALPDHGFSIWVHDSDAYLWVVADGSGNWAVDWTDQVDLVRGSNGNSHECDDDGDCTWAGWNVANPQFSVETPFSVWSHGEGWVEGRTVTLVVDDDDDDTNGILYTDSVLVERWGPEPWEVGWNFELEGLFEIEPGHFVTVDDGVDIAKALWVEEIDITEVDEDGDTISGSASAGMRVEVNAGGHDSEAYRSVEADGNGEWVADFSSPGDEEHEQDVFDIAVGTGGAAQVFDEDGDSTHRGWSIDEPPTPAFSVETPFYVWSHGEGWIEDRTLTLTVDSDDDPTNGTLYMDETLVERWGPEAGEVGWSFELEDIFEIEPGHYVSVYDGVEIEKYLWVEDLEITEIDEDADTITGTAIAGMRVEVNAGNEDYEAYRSVEADENGDWFADFANPGDEEHEQDVFDITIGTGGAAQIFDDDGDSTHRGWSVEEPPNPNFFVRPDGDELWGHEWHGGGEVTITIDDDDDSGNGVLFETVTGLEDGYFEVYIGDEYDILPGHHVVVTDGVFTKAHWVSELMVTEVDVDTDMVHGTAEPGAEVFVGSSLPAEVWEHLNFQFGPDNRNPDSFNEYLEFRQAVAHLVDRQLIAAEVPGADYAIESYVDAYIPELSQHAWAQYPYDPATAATLVEGLCADLGRDCVLDPPVAVLTTTEDNENRQIMADLLVPLFDMAGIELQLDLEHSSVFFGETLDAGTWDVGEWAWLGADHLPWLVASLGVFDPLERTDPNYYNWGTPDSTVIDSNTDRMAELIGLMDGTDDWAEIEGYLAEAEQILADQVVILPLYVLEGDPEVEGPYRVVAADPDGNWTADFSMPWEDQDRLDIKVGFGGYAEESDDDGDATHAGWQAAAESAVVEGHVYLDGSPLPDVEVFMAPDEVFTCTDADGYFSFEGVSPVGDALVATGPAYSDAGCGNTAFVDPDGMPLLVAGEGDLFLVDGYEYVEFNVEYAAAIQFVSVEDITGTPTPVDDVVIHAYDRNDEEFVDVFGHDPDPSDYQAILDTGIGEFTWIDWTGAALDHEPGLAEMRYPHIPDVLILAELDPIQGAQSYADEFFENLDGIVEGPEIVFQIGDAGPTVTVEDVVMNEGNRRGRTFVTFVLDEPVGDTVTVEWTTEDGTALAGEDYLASGGTIRFNPGQTEATRRIRILGDTMLEGDESFHIVLLSVDGAAAGEPGTVTLLNDDAEAPELSVEDVEVLEGDRRGKRVAVTFTLSEPAPSVVSVIASTVAGTALPGDDYLATSRTVRIGAGSTSATLYVRIVSDTIPEPDEYFTIEATNPVGVTIVDGSGEVLILNDD